MSFSNALKIYVAVLCARSCGLVMAREIAVFFKNKPVLRASSILFSLKHLITQKQKRLALINIEANRFLFNNYSPKYSARISSYLPLSLKFFKPVLNISTNSGCLSFIVANAYSEAPSDSWITSRPIPRVISY